ncbi:MAG: hypothetical protein ACI4PJ_00745 [Acutalibacteraceae bacterium]
MKKSKKIAALVLSVFSFIQSIPNLQAVKKYHESLEQSVPSMKFSNPNLARQRPIGYLLRTAGNSESNMTFIPFSNSNLAQQPTGFTHSPVEQFGGFSQPTQFTPNLQAVNFTQSTQSVPNLQAGAPNRFSSSSPNLKD